MTQPVCIECKKELKDREYTKRCSICLGLLHEGCYDFHLGYHDVVEEWGE